MGGGWGGGSTDEILPRWGRRGDWQKEEPIADGGGDQGGTLTLHMGPERASGFHLASSIALPGLGERS